jgi:hypothetical protein
MIIALFLIGFAAVMIATGLVYSSKAPIGYEDDEGFHYDDRADESVYSNFSKVNAASLKNFLKADIVVPVPFAIRWSTPFWGIAAVCIMLLVLHPGTIEKDKQLASSKKLKRPQLASAEMAGVTARIQSSKFMHTLCQRFNQVE